MADNGHINKLVEDTLNSMDLHKRAKPQPYLLTRIQARLGNPKESTFWDRLTSIITKPAVAMACMLLIALLNIIIISSNNDRYNNQQENISDAQGFSIATTAAVYDIENIEP